MNKIRTLNTICFVFLIVLCTLVSAQEEDKYVPHPYTNKVLQVLSPSDVGLNTLRSDNIEIKKIGSTTYTEHMTDELYLRNAAKVLEGKRGHQYLFNLLPKLKNGSIAGTPVKRSLEVLEIYSVYENVDLRAYITKEEIVVNIEEDLKEFRLVVVIDKYVTSNHSDFLFVGEKPAPYKQEPLVFTWTYKDLKVDDVINVTYYVKSLVIGDEESYFLALGNPVNVRSIRAEDGNRGGILGTDLNIADDIREALGKRGMDFANFLLVLSIVAVLMFFSGIVLLELDGRHAFEGVKNICRDLEAVIRIGKSNKEIVESYICECIDQGHDPEDIRIHLARAGWNEHAIDKLLNKYK